MENPGKLPTVSGDKKKTVGQSRAGDGTGIERTGEARCKVSDPAGN